MRFFLQEESNPQLEEGDKEFKIGTTNSYVEFEYKKEDTYIVTYLASRSETTAFVVACLDHLFDPIAEQVENEDEDALQAEFKAWPSFATLLQNGVNDRYSKGALIQLEDPDCGEKKWFVSTVIGNVDFEKQQDLASTKIAQAIELVLTKTVQMLEEMNNNKPHYVREAAKSLLKGIGGLVLAGLLQPTPAANS